jgi:hypothetical protein
MQSESQKSLSQKKFLSVMIALIAILLIDTSFVRIYDLIEKNFILLQSKLILFSVNSSLCLLLQFYLIRYIRNSLKLDRLNKTLKVKSFYIISLVSLCVLGSLIGFLIFQQYYNNYYDTSISIAIIIISYGTAAALIIWLSLLFFSWYRSSHNLIVLLYLVSMSGIAFNLIMTASFASIKVGERPYHTGVYIGGGGDISGGRHLLLDNVFRVSSFISFFSIWITTAVLMNYYRERLVSAVLYWLILALPLIYFLITYFYQFILAKMLISYLVIDPITVSIILSAFLSLSKPIGGLIFGAAFWNISKIISYERNIKTYMIISGWGIFLIFAANQASAQMLTPYPPFGLVTVTILTTAAYLMLLGIYNSAKLVSVNNELRRSIHKHALESKLLGLIGQAEMEKEIQRTVKQVTIDKYDLEKDLEEPVELDAKELEKYIEFVVREVRKESKHYNR